MRCFMCVSCRLPLFAALWVALALAAPRCHAQPRTADDAKLLQGTWEGYVVEGKGQMPDRGPVHLRLTISATTIRAMDLDSSKRDMGTGTYKLEPTKPMKEIDATGVLLPGKRVRTFLGIYELKGDTLKWCVDNKTQGRPTAFQTGGGHYLLILKRVK